MTLSITVNVASAATPPATRRQTRQRMFSTLYNNRRFIMRYLLKARQRLFTLP